MKNKLNPVITIDGASGTGKGVVTHYIARKLGWHLLDSGVLYRILAFNAEKLHIASDDESALADLANNLTVQFVSKEISIPPRIHLEGQDVTELIRSETIGNLASKIGALPKVREALLNRQRAFQKPPGLVTDGRDMGTVIFPDAILKIFLIASPEVRALRRFNQLKEIGIHVNLSDLVEELRERDKRDCERAVAPLKPADDAICINTDNLSIEAVVTIILAALKKVL